MNFKIKHSKKSIMYVLPSDDRSYLHLVLSFIAARDHELPGLAS